MTRWRLLYDMPINDPRVASITDHEALLDLTIKRYHAEEVRRAVDPEAQVEDDMANPDMLEHLARIERAFSSPEAVRMMRAFTGKGPKRPEPAKGLRLRTKED